MTFKSKNNHLGGRNSEGDKVTRKCHGQIDKGGNYYIYNEWSIFCPYTHGTFIQKSGDTK